MPPDVVRAVLCEGRLTLCDGYGCAFLESCKFVCMLEIGHDGPHRDEFECDGKLVVVKWHADNNAVFTADGEHLPLAR